MRVAIVGGGIGGLTAAIALAHAGCSVDVFERTPRLEESGAGIQLSPNATAILQELGVFPSLAGIFEPRALAIRSGVDGRHLANMPLATEMRRRYGAPYCVLRRADLLRGLAAAAGESERIILHPGTEIEALARDGDGWRLAAGDFVGKADLVVAADGVSSRMRTRHFAGADARASGATAWRALLPAELARGVLDLDVVGLWLCPDAHLVHYPIDGGGTLNLVFVTKGKPPAEIMASPALRNLVRGIETWSPRPLLEADASSRWTLDRAALLGDAAHAMLPTLAQGAAMAIEDASVLSRLLATHDIDAALAAYAATRRERVTRVAQEARRNLRIYGMRGAPARLRDLALAALPTNFHLRRLDWLFGWRAAAKFPLPGERHLP